MAQSSEPLTVEVVTEEIFAALEAMGEDGDSELGAFTVKPEKGSTQILVIKTKGGGSFTVCIAKVQP